MRIAVAASSWSALAKDLKDQIIISGQAVCHITVMARVLRERIIGEATIEKYAAALAVFMKETKTKARLESTEQGKFFVFSPLPDTQ
jgi:hypothetical protein